MPEARVGLLGGTFDPVHLAHVALAQAALQALQLDQVRWIPAGQPWQKVDRDVSAAEDRYLMTVIATASNPRFSVSRVDVDREGPTYTVDTLRDIREERGGDVDLYFITGADALTQILTWHKVHSLFELAHFVGCTRPGADLTSATVEAIPHDRVTLLEVPALAISSTDCRDRQRAGRPVWYLVPDGVVQYIHKHRLYSEVST